MDFSNIVSQYESKQIRKLSIKENSAVYAVKNEDGGIFVLRIYDRPMPGYQALAGQGRRGAAGDISGMPKVYSCRTEQGCFVVEEEYIDGISLQELIDGGERMSGQRAAAVTASVCRTLSQLHKKGVIHRDVKPEHIMLTPDGEIFVIDLDAAMRILPEKKNDTRLLGTAIYAAPEQFGLTRSDVRTDVFAVGILLNMLLTGEHPAVVRCRDGKLAEIIEKCTLMNPLDRYQNMDELLAALDKAAEEEGWKLRARRNRRRLAAAALLLLLSVIVALCIAFFPGGSASADRISESAVIYGDYVPADESYMICTKGPGNSYQPIPVESDEYTRKEDPAMFFLTENTDRTFYILCRNESEKLDFPLLDSYRQTTPEMAAVKAVKEESVNIDQKAYAVWQVKVDKNFTGAARVGFSFNGSLAKYNTDGGGQQVKYMWILDESFGREDFSDGYGGNLIPCAADLSGRQFESISALEASGAILGEGGIGPLTKEINMSLTPYDEANAFYLVHPQGTVVQDDSCRVYACDQDGSGFGVGGARGGVFTKSVSSAFVYSAVGSVMVGGSEMQVTKVSLKEYSGHQDIEASFYLTKEGSEDGAGTETDGFAGVRLQMGMNIVVLGAEQWGSGALTIDSQANILEKALGFTPESLPLDFVKSGDRYEAFYPQACALISDEGQGRMISLNVELSQNCRIEDITDGNGKPLAYMAEERKGYVLLDEGGDPVYDAEAIFASGWTSGITGTTVGNSENRCLLDVTSCVEVRMEDYAQSMRHGQAGTGNTADFEAFLSGSGPDGRRHQAELRASYMAYTIYFDPEDDASRNEIVFRVG